MALALSGGISIFGGIYYMLFAEATIQWWAMGTDPLSMDDVDTTLLPGSGDVAPTGGDGGSPDLDNPQGEQGDLQAQTSSSRRNACNLFGCGGL